MTYSFTADIKSEIMFLQEWWHHLTDVWTCRVFGLIFLMNENIHSYGVAVVTAHRIHLKVSRVLMLCWCYFKHEYKVNGIICLFLPNEQEWKREIWQMCTKRWRLHKCEINRNIAKMRGGRFFKSEFADLFVIKSCFLWQVFSPLSGLLQGDKVMFWRERELIMKSKLFMTMIYQERERERQIEDGHLCCRWDIKIGRRWHCCYVSLFGLVITQFSSLTRCSAETSQRRHENAVSAGEQLKGFVSCYNNTSLVTNIMECATCGPN